MDDDSVVGIFIAIMGAVMGGIVTAIFTIGIVNASWQNDCEKLGQTRSSNKVYECHLKG